MNVRDSDLIARRLRAIGLAQAETEDEADVVIVNSCSVRAKAEDKALGKLGLLCATKRERPGRVIGLTGCMAARLGPDIFTLLPHLSFSVGPRAQSQIPAFVTRCLETGAERLAEFGVLDAPPETPEEARADLARTAGTQRGKAADHADGEQTVTVAAGPAQNFVTILYGCERRCSYCIVPSVRGEEQSRCPADILTEVRAEAARGVRDVCLLGQSVMRYGQARFQWPDAIPSPGRYTEPLPRLLEYIAREVPEVARLRFTSGHPSGVTPELVRAMATIPAVCPHLHLPMQSGSDRILREMRRGYDSATYLDAVRRLREAIPDIAITTDIIVGYPGETEADFEATRRVMEEADYGIRHNSLFPCGGKLIAERTNDATENFGFVYDRNELWLLRNMTFAVTRSITYGNCEGERMTYRYFIGNDLDCFWKYCEADDILARVRELIRENESQFEV